MKILAFLISAFLPLAIYANSSGYLINVPVSNMYSTDSEEMDVVSQALYGESIKIIETPHFHWYYIETEDGYRGWITAAEVHKNNDYRKSHLIRRTKSLATHVYRVPDTSPQKPILTLPYGVPVKVMTPIEENMGRWVDIELVDGTNAWVHKGDLELFPRLKTLSEIISLSKELLGLPYTWGGRSSFGFDCSGFIQFLYKQMGVQLPRDSHQQVKAPGFVTVKRNDLEPGDLIFFGKPKIFHVGLYLGDGQFISSCVRDAGPKIAISQLGTSEYPFATARRYVGGKK